MEAKDRIIVALDVNTVHEATDLADQLATHVGGFKIGLEFITASLAQLIAASEEDQARRRLEDLRELFGVIGDQLFWDGKFCDIPNTVGGAARGLQPLKPKFFNVHASAGQKAVEQAVANKGQGLVLGVTVLTSIDKDECQSIFGAEPNVKVLQFALMLAEAKADGIICSPQELGYLAEATRTGAVPESLGALIRVIPDTRPSWAAPGDQARITTPSDAVKNGANYLVIGRPITKPPAEIGSPLDAAKRIAEEIASAFAGA